MENKIHWTRIRNSVQVQVFLVCKCEKMYSKCIDRKKILWKNYSSYRYVFFINLKKNFIAPKESFSLSENFSSTWNIWILWELLTARIFSVPGSDTLGFSFKVLAFLFTFFDSVMKVLLWSLDLPLLQNVLVGGEEENASANLLALCKVRKHFSHQLLK